MGERGIKRSNRVPAGRVSDLLGAAFFFCFFFFFFCFGKHNDPRENIECNRYVIYRLDSRLNLNRSVEILEKWTQYDDANCTSSKQKHRNEINEPPNRKRGKQDLKRNL